MAATMMQYSVAALLFLGVLTRGHLPEDDFRIVSREDLMAADSDLYEDNSTRAFSQLLFDVARDQVIVGARDALYRLSLRGLRPLERAAWPAPTEKAQFCQDKGQSEEDCHNYIKVLLAHGHKLFACGTSAFSPVCSWREIESVGTVSEWVPGVARCPCDPRSNVTALLATGGEYYAGTPTDFTSSDTAICKSRGAAPRGVGTLRTTQYDLNWLNEPQFVGSFEDEHFVFFVFREVAVEYMNCGKTIYSRIARVCKNDSGGEHVTTSVGTWSTFLKARIKCATPGDVPFHHDEVQAVEYLPQEKLLVATFTTNSNSIAGSAVCVYNMSDIQAAFEGPYKVQDSPGSSWEPRSPTRQAREHFRCVTEDSSSQALEYHRYHLMYESVQPISGEPVYRATLQRFTHVTVDVTATKSGRQLVAYVATQDSDVLKLAVLPRYDGACLVEVLRLQGTAARFDVLAMQFVKDTMSLYIGSETGVLRVAGERCARLASRSACVGAGDPHCGWDDASGACAHASELVLPTLSCPTDRTPVDGGWSSWSAWEPCMQDGTAHTAYGERPDLCACRARACDNPRPKHGGQPCEGPSISVSNCTVHGGWSAWSGWSECSATCGIAVKLRRRACAAPEPRHGGRVCVGLDVQDAFCNQPPCPDPELAPVDGGWSAWGAWSACASAGGAGCGPAAGWRERRRTCSAPTPSHGGAGCEGNKVDRQPCDLRACEMRKATAFTPWVQIPGNSSDGSYTTKRFKFLCKAASSEQIKLTMSLEEEGRCAGRGSCGAAGEERGWGAWSGWGACSAPCNGRQTRTRACLTPPCRSAGDMRRPCNAHACSEANVGTGEWGVWGEWGAWAACDSGDRVRRRACAGARCAGAATQLAGAADDDNELYAMPAYRGDVATASFVAAGGARPLGVGGIVACVLAAFVMGCLVCLAGVIFFQRRGARLPWARQARVPSSPHYITAKQNSYVTVPLKEVPRKAKRQPSFTGIGGSSGILLSKSNNLSNANNHNNTMTTPKLYPKAIANEYDSMGTLRRHSNQPNNKNNLDGGEDKFY